jgi:hypothetical protein
MKKIFFLVLILAFYHSYGQQNQAPNEKQPPSGLGIFAGPNLNYLSYHDKVTTIEGRNTSFHAGIWFQRNIDTHFAVQPSLTLVMRGGKIKEIDSTIRASLTNAEFTMNFLFLYKRLIIGAGPNFSYGLIGKLKASGKKRNAYDETDSFERTLKRFEFGGNFMVGYALRKRIFVTVNFSPGFTNIYKGDGSAPDNLKATTRSFGASLGYLFGIDK